MNLRTGIFTVILGVVFACGGARPNLNTEGVGQACPSSGCAEGQTCVTLNAQSTCELKCDADAECPEGWRCNLPPVTPDSVPNACVK